MVMMHRRTIMAIPAALAFGGRAWAQTTPTPPALDLPTQVAKATAAQVRPIAGHLLKQKMEAWIADSGLADRGLTVLQGHAPVTGLPTNPDWVRFRMLAYEAAVLDAQAEDALVYGQQVRSDTVRDFLKEQDSAKPYQKIGSPDQAAELVRKALAVANGHAWIRTCGTRWYRSQGV